MDQQTLILVIVLMVIVVGAAVAFGCVYGMKKRGVSASAFTAPYRDNYYEDAPMGRRARGELDMADGAAEYFNQ